VPVGKRLEEPLELSGVVIRERREHEWGAALYERKLFHNPILSTLIDESRVLHLFTAID
jgi:hypothetical protein